MDLIRAVILGILEGLTEFLPISSTGHLILAEPWLGIDRLAPQWQVFRFLCQVGAIAAVILYFWPRLWRRALALNVAWSRHLLVKLVIAIAPAVVIGLLLGDWVERNLEDNSPAVAAALILGGLGMEYIDRRYRRRSAVTIDDITLRQAFWIGVAQCVAIWPGISRSAATIMGGMVVGLPAAVAAEFSFYLAIPTLLGAGLLRLIRHWQAITPEIAGVLLIGAATAFLVALAVVAGFMHYVQHRPFTPFVVYRIVLGLIVLAWHVDGR